MILRPAGTSYRTTVTRWVLRVNGLEFGSQTPWCRLVAQLMLAFVSFHTVLPFLLSEATGPTREGTLKPSIQQAPSVIDPYALREHTVANMRQLK